MAPAVVFPKYFNFKVITGQQKNTFCTKREYDISFLDNFWVLIPDLACGTSRFGVTAKGFFGYIDSCALIY